MIVPNSVPDLLRAPLPTVPVGKYPVRILACGLPSSVDHIVYRLYLLNFAEVREWSPPLPSPVQGEVIRILTRYFSE